MKKFSGISRIFLILSSFGFLFIFNSCSDLLSNSSGTVSVSLGSEVFQRALSEDQLRDLGATSYRLEVSIKGDYEARQERIWTSTELLETAGNNEGLFTANSTYVQIAEILAKKLSEGASFNFEGIPVGKTVRIEGKFYQTTSRGEESYTELLFHGSSAEKQIEYGTNELPISIFRAYAEFPLEITLNFPAGTDVDSFVDSLLLVMAVSDSDKVKDLSALLASGDKFAIYNAIRAFQFSSSLYDYPRISCVENYEITGTSVKITDTVSLPVSITDKNRGEELAMVPIIYSLTLGGKYCVSGSIPKITPVKGQTTSTSFDVQKLGIIDTATVTYTYDSGMKYYLDSGQEFQVSSYSPNFCFDADGYFYALDNSSISIQSSNPRINDGSLSGVENLSGITVDHATNILYAWYGMQATFSIYKLPTVIAQGVSEDKVTISPTFDSTVFGSDNNGGMCYHDGELLVINNGKAYGFVSGGDPTLTNGKFYELDLTEGTPAAELININDKISEALPGVSERAKITDMLYQDGAVYILLNDSSDGGSRGAVIKYDTVSETISTLGWSNEDVVSNTDKFYVYYYSSSNNATEHIYDSYSMVDGTAILGNKVVARYAKSKPSVYAPSDASSAFYGPSKFIAIKPRRLVISDEGIAVYTNNDGALSYKNVNRIVTVDLESFAIAETSDASVSFEADSTNLLYWGTATACNTFTGIGGSVYIANGSYWNATADDGSFTLGIPCSDDGE